MILSDAIMRTSGSEASESLPNNTGKELGGQDSPMAARVLPVEYDALDIVDRRLYGASSIPRKGRLGGPQSCSFRTTSNRISGLLLG